MVSVGYRTKLGKDDTLQDMTSAPAMKASAPR